VSASTYTSRHIHCPSTICSRRYWSGATCIRTPSACSSDRTTSGRASGAASRTASATLASGSPDHRRPTGVWGEFRPFMGAAPWAGSAKTLPTRLPGAPRVTVHRRTPTPTSCPERARCQHINRSGGSPG
jgi:hypothetical protein